jgi:putative FmdB family regulatory protein
MPLYEYYCSDCQARFELLVGHQHADEVVCTKCHGEKTRRLLSMFSAKRGNAENSSGSELAPTGGCRCGGGCGCH